MTPARRCLGSFLCLILALVGMACGGSGSANGGGAVSSRAPSCGDLPGVPSVAGVQNGVLVTRDQSLYLRDMKSGKESKLFTAPPGLFVTYPVWSPDGKQFLFLLD